MVKYDVDKVKIRYTTEDDFHYLMKWLQQPGMEDCFPMFNEQEVQDAASRWISFVRVNSSLTIEYDGQPCGLVTLYLLSYRRTSHQCEWGVILSNEYQDIGLGDVLIGAITNLAKNSFGIDLLHVQVCEKNLRGIAFFKKHGYKEFGRQKHWLKDNNNYVARIFMERFI